MDIKLNLDGGTYLENGDFQTCDLNEEYVYLVNRIVRGWLGNFNIRSFAGKRNTRENAVILKRFLDKALNQYLKGTSARIVPLDKDSIAIFIMETATNQSITQLIFKMTNGFIYSMEEYDTNDANKYQEKLNNYI